MTPSQRRPAKRFLIRAGTFHQAANYALANNISPNQWTYLDNPEKLHGLQASKVEVIQTGTYWEHRFAREIDELIVITCVETKND